MNLDDLVNGKVDFDSLPDVKPPAPAAQSEPEVSDTSSVREESKPAPVAPVSPPVKPTPNTPVLGYATDGYQSAYAAKPIPGADFPEQGVQSRQFLKDYLILGVVVSLIMLTYVALPLGFGIDVPGKNGVENPPLTWFKKPAATPIVAPVVQVVPVAPAPVVVAPAPAMVAPAPGAPAQPVVVLEAPASAPVQTEPMLSAPAPAMETPPVPSAAQSSASIGLPPPPPPMATVSPVAQVGPHGGSKQEVTPKKVQKPVAEVKQAPQPGSLEYAEQQMRSFTQH